MAIRVKSVADVAAKYAEVTPGPQKYYEANASVAGVNWQAGTQAASKSFQQAITSGDMEKKFLGGIKRAGAEKYNRKVKDVGVARYGPGVQAAQTDYANGVSPYLDEISKLTLPARAPRGDVSNLQRSAVVAKALNAKRLALKAAGV